MQTARAIGTVIYTRSFVLSCIVPTVFAQGYRNAEKHALPSPSFSLII